MVKVPNRGSEEHVKHHPRGCKTVRSFALPSGELRPRELRMSNGLQAKTSRRKMMILVKVINFSSDRFGATGTVRPTEWDENGIWVQVHIHGRDSLVARRDLKEIGRVSA
jgi:hypothetical protein